MLQHLNWFFRWAGLGLLIWIILVFTLPDRGPEGHVEKILLFHFLVLTPLVFHLYTGGKNLDEFPGYFRLAVYIHPVAVGLAATSFFFDRSITTAIFTTPWLAMALLFAVYALHRISKRRIDGFDIVETTLDGGVVFFLVGGGWLFLTRWGGWPPLPDIMVVLAAIHSNFSGFVLLTLCGKTGRFLQDKGAKSTGLAKALLPLVVVGFLLVANGITGQTYDIPYSSTGEWIGALILTAAVLLLAGLTIFSVVPRLDSVHPKAFLVISSISAVGAMGLAATFALQIPLDTFYLTIPQMIHLHGWLHCLGFALPAILGWVLVQDTTVATKNAPTGGPDESAPISKKLLK